MAMVGGVGGDKAVARRLRGRLSVVEQARARTQGDVDGIDNRLGWE